VNRTKIICTAGPPIYSEAKIEALVKNEMSVIRFNCSHGDLKTRTQFLKKVRRVEKKLGKPIGVMLDLQGPKLRTGDLPEPFDLKPGEVWQLSYGVKADKIKKIIPVGFKGLSRSIKKGDEIFIADGVIHTKVIKKNLNRVFIKIIHGNRLDSRKGLNIPYYKGPLKVLSAKDKQDLKWGVEHAVDFVALSFIRTPHDIRYLQKEIQTLKPKSMPLIIAKIEKPEAVQNIEEITILSDGILIARGDLGVEMRQEQVPVIQKRVIDLCRYHRTPVIVATQMLDSMRLFPTPTRAEVSDVASAIYAGTDAVMLTGETSAGKYPIKAVAVMNRIIKQVENHMIEKTFRKVPEDFGVMSFRRAFAFNVVQMADDVKARAIVVLNRRGEMTKRISKIHPKQPVYSLALNKTTYRQLSLYWGVFPLNMKAKKTSERITRGIEILKTKRVVKTGDRLVFFYRDFDSDHLNMKIVEV